MKKQIVLLFFSIYYYLYLTEIINNMKTVSFAGFFMFFVFVTAQTNWHVAVNGSDTTGDGSITAPFASLQKAGDLVQAGDTIFVHQGTYYNSQYGNGDIWKNNVLLYLNANGLPGQYIVIMPYPGDHVILKSDGKHNILVKYSSYIKIQGFEFEGVGTQITQSMADDAWGLYKDENGNIHDLAAELGIDINDPSIRGTVISKPVLNNIKKPSYYNGHGLVCARSHHIIFTENIIHDFPASGLRADKSDYVTITNNEIYHNSYWTSVGVGALTIATSEVRPAGDTYDGVKIKILKNYIHDNENRLISWNPFKDFINMVIDEGSGIFLTRNADTYSNGYFLIANNISNINGASGIVIHKTNRAIVEYNTVYKNGNDNDGRAGGIGLNSVQDAEIRNNIAYARPDHWALYKNGGTLTNVNVNNNVVYNENGSEPCLRNLTVTNLIEADPQFVDIANNDFHLSSTSPAISFAIATTYTNDDFEGNLRDALPDAGALEFLVGSINKAVTKSFQFYPNPVNKQLIIKGLNAKKHTIRIYDLSERMIFKQRIKPVSNDVLITLDFLKTGIYSLDIGGVRKMFIKN